MPVTFANALPVARQQFGISKEAAKGTYLAPTAFLSLDTFVPDDKITELPVLGLRGSNVVDYGMVQGVGTAGISLGGDVYADTIGWPLGGVLGDLTVTGAAAPYINAFSTLYGASTSQPASHSLTHFYVANSARGYAGAQWAELVLTYTSTGLAKFTGKTTSLLSAQETNPVASYTSVMPFAAWQCVALIAGVSTVVVTAATVTMTRKLMVTNGLNGTQNPSEIVVGPLSVDWKLSCQADPNDLALKYYLNNTQPSLDLTMTQSAGAILQVHSSVVAMTAGPFKMDKEIIEIDLAGTAIANVTDAGVSGGESPVKVSLTNAVNGGYC